MISIDTNVLVYAHRTDFAEHARAQDAVAGALMGSEPVGLCWPVLHEFLAVVTNPRLFVEPTPMDTAMAQVQDWLSSPVYTTIREGSRHLESLASGLANSSIAGGAIHDARIAAICLDSGVRELWTVDRDFSRFPQIQVRNPLVA